jgi:hypothetical protein
VTGNDKSKGKGKWKAMDGEREEGRGGDLNRSEKQWGRTKARGLGKMGKG